MLSNFHPVVAQWFSETLGTPTSAQARGWAAIRDRRHTLIAAHRLRQTLRRFSRP
jgi:ATP-dependent Lhr-like helicase